MTTPGGDQNRSLKNPNSVPRTRSYATFRKAWSALGYCREGRDHSARDEPCQDSIAYGVFETTFWLAVADGLGSATNSHVGSDTAVRAVGEALENTEQVADPVTMATGLNVAGHVAQKLKETADLLDISVSSLATTLQFVFVDTQSGRYSYSVVGDGHCIVREPSGNSRILGPTRRTADYGAPHILLEDWQTYFYNEVGELDAESLILTFTDGLDPLFITPKSEAIPIKVATPQSVDAFNAMFSKGYNENQAIFAASQTIEKDEYSDRIRDDVSFIALKWHAKAKSSTNNADRQKPSMENAPKEAKSDGTGKGTGLASSKRPSSNDPSQVDEESERERKITSHESATLGSDTTSPNPLANDEDNSFKRARNSPFRMLLRIFVGAVSASAIIATVLFLAALYMGWITLDVAF